MKFDHLREKIAFHLRRDRRWLNNAIRFSFKKIFSLADIQTSGRILLSGFGTTLRFSRNATVILGKDIENDGHCTIIAEQGAHLEIGDGVYFNDGMMISCLDHISIGSGTLFGPNVKIFDNNHRFSRSSGVSRMHTTAPITIGKNCWIASNVTILKNASIGDHCLIGAGCVIKETIPTGSIVTLQQELNVISARDRE